MDALNNNTSTTYPETVWQIGSTLHHNFIDCIEAVALQRISDLHILHDMGKKILAEQNKKLSEEYKKKQSPEEISCFINEYKENIDKIVSQNGIPRIIFKNNTYINKILKKGINGKNLPENQIERMEQEISSYSDAMLLRVTESYSQSAQQRPKELKQCAISYVDDRIKKLKETVLPLLEQTSISNYHFDCKIVYDCINICSITQSMKYYLLQLQEFLPSEIQTPIYSYREALPGDKIGEILNHILIPETEAVTTPPK